MPGDLSAAAVTVAQNTVHRGTFHCVWNLVNDDDRYLCTNKRLIDRRDLLRELKDECDRQGMNIRPKADGSIPRESVEILDQVGGYVRENADSIFDTFRLPGYSYEIQELLFTCKPHKLFAHVVEAIHRSCLGDLKYCQSGKSGLYHSYRRKGGWFVFPEKFSTGILSEICWRARRQCRHHRLTSEDREPHPLRLPRPEKCGIPGSMHPCREL